MSLAEDLVLEFVDVVLEARDERPIVAEQAVKDRVHDRKRSTAEQVRGWASSFSRTRCRSGGLTCRAVITNCGPAKMRISPNSTLSVSSM